MLLGTMLFFLYFALLYNAYGLVQSDLIVKYRAIVDCKAGDEDCYNSYLGISRGTG